MRDKSLNQLRELLRELEDDLVARLDLEPLPSDPQPAQPSQRAYEGLASSVQEANQHRRAHLAHLVQLDRALDAATTLEVPRGVLADLMTQVGLERVADISQSHLFADDGGGESPRLAEAAYVDASTGRVVRQGRITSGPVNG